MVTHRLRVRSTRSGSGLRSWTSALASESRMVSETPAGVEDSGQDGHHVLQDLEAEAGQQVSRTVRSLPDGDAEPVVGHPAFQPCRRWSSSGYDRRMPDPECATTSPD